MPLATALIVAAAAWQAQRIKADGGEDDGTEGEGGRARLTRSDALRHLDLYAGAGATPPDLTPDFLENKVSIELLPLERTLTVLEHPISTVSFYKCASGDVLNATTEKIEGRVQSILKANPWLGGWLVTGKGVGSFDKTPRLWHDPTGNEMAPGIFQKLSHDDVPLDPGTPYARYEGILSLESVTVRTNPEIVNRKGEPSFRVTVVPAPGGDGFAMVQSMSHVCGDGHTFYRIHGMLLGSEPVASLIPERELLFSRNVMDLMGRQEAHYVHHITADPAWMKLFRMGSELADEDAEANKLRGRVFLVNRHWVGNIKASHMTEGNITDVCTSTLRSPMTPISLKELEGDQSPTQSTNDILVSWFWNLVNPHVGLMAVNFRNRVDAVTADHAGNYANPIPYTKEDYESAILIRKSLETCRRAGRVMGTNDPTTLPRPNHELTFSIISNWSSFLPKGKESNETDEKDWSGGPDVELVRHLPIVNPGSMMTKMPRRMSFLIVFSSGPDEIGCVLIAPGRVMEEIDCCGVVKETIAEF